MSHLIYALMQISSPVCYLTWIFQSGKNCHAVEFPGFKCDSYFQKQQQDNARMKQQLVDVQAALDARQVTLQKLVDKGYRDLSNRPCLRARREEWKKWLVEEKSGKAVCIKCLAEFQADLRSGIGRSDFGKRPGPRAEPHPPSSHRQHHGGE